MSYFAFRAEILNNTVQHQLMDKVAAKAMYERLLAMQQYKLVAAMNKQKGEKKQVAYLTAMVNMLIEANSQGIEYDHDPRQLTTVTRLHEVLGCDGSSDAATTIREVVETVVLHPVGDSKNRHTSPPQIEVIGRLALLLDQKDGGSLLVGGPMVAEEGSRKPP